MIIDGNTLRDSVAAHDIEVYRTLPTGTEVRIYDGDLKIGSNSIDVTLGHTMLYSDPRRVIDPYDSDSIAYETMTPNRHPNGDAFTIFPGRVYLGFAAERFAVNQLIINRGTKEARKVPVVQMLDGRSTVGRIGITVHVTAGFGDVGFDGNFTLEIVNLNGVPAILYPGMRIGQIAFHEVSSHEYQPTYHGAYKPNHVGRAVPPLLGKDRF